MEWDMCGKCDGYGRLEGGHECATCYGSGSVPLTLQRDGRIIVPQTPSDYFDGDCAQFGYPTWRVS